MKRPFSCGSQFGDWRTSNCERCTKSIGDRWEVPYKCDIECAIDHAYLGTGEIEDGIAQRMNYSPDKYNWCCGEVEWTEEWKEKHEPTT
jgi:hypothetical protein